MKRIGTVSAAAGLIYLGAWMIVDKINPETGTQIFKWWPIVIIILGVEVLLHFTRKEGERVGFNFLVIPVLIFMLLANVYQGFRYNFNGIFSNGGIFDGVHINMGDIDLGDYKRINTSKTLNAYGTRLYLDIDNASINVKKSSDGNIKIDAVVYVDHNSWNSKYDIVEKKEADGYSVSIKENYVKKVSMDVYIPEGYDVKLNSDNLDIKSSDDLLKSSLNIEADNINMNFNGLESLAADFDNGNMNIRDTKDVKLTGNNANINIRGTSENIDIKSDHGKIDVNNEKCGLVNIDLKQGVASVSTEDENVSVNIELQQGVAGINNEKSVNGGMNRTFGQGQGKVEMKVHQGTANFRN